VTDKLQVKGFGFSIPSGATVDGVLVEVEIKSSLSGRALAAKLMKAGIGDTGNLYQQSIGTSDAYLSFGGASDLWGTTHSDTIENDADFGVSLYVGGGFSGTTTISVDHIRVTVYYTEGGGGGAASRLTKYAQNIPHMHGNNRFIRIGR
jgi:hypothetical protein